MTKLNIEDLKKIKENVKGTLNLREGKERVKITVHMGTCGIAAGARKIMSAFLEEIEKRGLNDIMLTSSGCAGLCNREPMATIEVKGEAPIKYIDLDEKKVVEIFDDHIINNKPVLNYILARGSETTI
ncbi:MAG: (2Fe-2S) ferredoxin domain-containing protein [Spirochaetota bacterium]|nr:(2Fe-2S) ferredoxin domain-containing protein [Spirochaetota bacterium]